MPCSWLRAPERTGRIAGKRESGKPRPLSLVTQHTALATRHAPRGTRHSAHGTRHARRGFTLMELCVVITILGLLLVMALPGMKTLENLNQLKSSARNLAAVFRYARGQAIFGEKRVEVRIDPKTGRYRLDLMHTAEDLSELHRRGRKIQFDEERIRQLADQVMFSEVFAWQEQINERGHVVVEFFPNGTATPVIVVLKDKRGAQMTLELARSTAQTRVAEGRPEDLALPGQEDVVNKKITQEAES